MNKNLKKNEIDMLNGNIFKSMFRFSLPLIATTLVENLYTAADTIVVGKFAGNDCLAAVSSTSSIIALVVNLFIGISTGVNVYIARLIGENKREKISNAIHTSILFSIIIGISIAIFGIAFSNKMLILTGSPNDVINLATKYLKIRFFGMPLMLLNAYGSSILRSKGDAKRPLIFSSFSGLINLFLNLLLVIVFRMDVDGVAIATNMSYVIGSCLIIYTLSKEIDEFRFNFHKLRINFEALKEIIAIGIPTGIQNSMFSLSNVLMQSSINSLGSTIMAGSGAGNSLVMFINCFINGSATATMTYVSQNYGAKNYNRIKKSIINGLMQIGIWSIISAFIAYFLPYKLVSIYTNDEIAIQAGVDRFRVTIYPYFIYGILQVSVGSLRGLSKGFAATIAMIIGVCGMRTLWLALYFPTHQTITGVMLAYPVSWFVASLFTVPFLLITLKKEKSLLLNE